MTNLKTLLFVSACAVSLASAADAQTAAPKTAEPQAQPTNVEELVVTARRREETLKDVPIAVSAYTAAAMDRTGVRDITALGGLRDKMALTFIGVIMAGFSMLGLPPALGYLAKEEIYLALPAIAWRKCA